MSPGSMYFMSWSTVWSTGAPAFTRMITLLCRDAGMEGGDESSNAGMQGGVEHGLREKGLGEGYVQQCQTQMRRAGRQSRGQTEEGASAGRQSRGQAEEGASAGRQSRGQTEEGASAGRQSRGQTEEGASAGRQRRRQAEQGGDRRAGSLMSSSPGPLQRHDEILDLLESLEALAQAWGGKGGCARFEGGRVITHAPRVGQGLCMHLRPTRGNAMHTGTPQVCHAWLHPAPAACSMRTPCMPACMRDLMHAR